MKILILSNCDLIANQGSGYVITGFASGLKNLGWEVKTVGPDDLTLIPRISTARQHRLAIGMWFRGRRMIKEYAPDVVEFYGGAAWLATLLLSMRSHRPFLIAAHSNGLEPFVTQSLQKLGHHSTLDGQPTKWPQRITEHLTYHAFTKSDVLVTVSDAERKFALEQRYQSADKILALDNALPSEFLGQSGACNDSKIIGYCGTWIVRKGIQHLAKALAIILGESPNWSVELVGVGEKFRVEDHFPPALKNRIKVTPFVGDKAHLHEIYRSWAIAVMPSLYESFGLVAAEAMACGCALVATRTGFAAGLKENVEACLVEATDTSLTNGIRSLIAEPERRRRIALAGQKRVQTLHWPDNVRRLHDFYMHHIQRRSKT